MALDELTQERIARNESAFRSANERIAELAEDSALEEDLALAEDLAPFICECADRDCTKIVQLSVVEYEAVRAHPRQFFVAPGHQAASLSVGRVHSENERFAVVEQTQHAGVVAERLDERARAPEAGRAAESE
jgi:hypothetical protein